MCNAVAAIGLIPLAASLFSGGGGRSSSSQSSGAGDAPVSEAPATEKASMYVRNATLRGKGPSKPLQTLTSSGVSGGSRKKTKAPRRARSLSIPKSSGMVGSRLPSIGSLTRQKAVNY